MVLLMKGILALLILLAACGPADAAIRICPHTGRPYDTNHGRYVDEPGTRYYAPGATPSRSRSSYSGGAVDDMEWDYQGYNEYLGY